MTIHHKFIIFLAAAFCISNIILGVLGQNEIGVYFTIDAIVFILTVMFFNLGSRAMSGLRPVGGVLWVGFLLIIALKISAII